MEHKVATISQLESSPVLAVEADGIDIVLVKSESGIHALEDRCTHQEVKLSGGMFENEQIECPEHGARFCIKTGKALCLPAVRPVRTFKVAVRGADIFVEV